MNARTRVKAEDAAPAADEPLHVKYRPTTFDHLIGQDAAVASIEEALKKATRPHAFLLTGPSGCGKTTIARIIARELQASDVVEVDAASNSGVEAMREIVAASRYQGFGKTPNKAIIIDECHALSKSAWQAMLKPIEEPPAHVFFFLCTTEAGKVPETIRTRCHSYDLKPYRYDDLMDLLERVDAAEKLNTPDSILKLVGRACDGSPRKALVMLSMVQSCRDADEAARLLESPLEDVEIIELCRKLLKGSLSFIDVTATLKRMPEMPAESVRIVLVNYFAGCVMNARTEKEAARMLDILAAFSKPFPATDKNAPLLLAFGDLLL